MTAASSLRHYELGAPVPGSVHSVCVSLPRLRDVVAYEEGDAAVTGAMRTGYPRFVRHPLVREATAVVERAAGVAPGELLLVASGRAAERLVAFAGGGEVVRGHAFAAVRLPEDRRRAGAKYLQHTGAAISSREAEDFLVAGGWRAEWEAEEVGAGAGAEARVRAAVAEACGAAAADDVHLARGGAAAFLAAYEALRRVQGRRGRRLWVQVGWLYLDTTRVLEAVHPEDGPPVLLDAVDDLAALEALVAARGPELAGIVTETPTNPLVQTADVARLRELADRAGAALVLDPTVASPRNVDVLSWADLLITSLTKYAGSRADVLAGALVLQPRSPFAGEVRAELADFLEPPGARDVARLAAQIGDWGRVVAAVNANTRRVAAWLEAHPAVARVWWAEAPEQRARYAAIARPGAGPGAIVSFTLRGPLAPVHDRLRMAKGPSFGAVFSIACPFLYLAHYDLVTTPAGRARLAAAGLSPELLRLSVGTEPVDEILGVLDEALA